MTALAANPSKDGRFTLSGAIKGARRAREGYEKFWKKYRSHVCGAEYRSGQGVRRVINYPYLFTSTFLPELAARTPEIGVRPMREYTDAIQAELHRLAINQILKRQQFIDELRLSI